MVSPIEAIRAPGRCSLGCLRSRDASDVRGQFSEAQAAGLAVQNERDRVVGERQRDRDQVERERDAVQRLAEEVGALANEAGAEVLAMTTAGARSSLNAEASGERWCQSASQP